MAANTKRDMMLTEQIPSRKTTRYMLTSPTMPSSSAFATSSLSMFRKRSLVFRLSIARNDRK